jgi:uncharacterized membrane protein YfcA
VTAAVTVGGTSVSVWQLAVLALAAILVGFAKTAIGGFGSVSVALFAAVLPARESTGALLPLLLVGDAMAVAIYRAHANWRLLLRLLPSVIVGVVAGTLFVARVDDDVMRRTIGAMLMALVGVHLWTRRRSARAAAVPEGEAAAAPTPGGRRLFTGTYGTLAGFTTMVANAGGPVMSLYLLSSGLTMLGFLGTATMFFAVVNLSKVPFSLGLDLITLDSLRLDLVLVPAVLLGGWLGRLVIHRIDEKLFERLVLVFTVVSAVNLLR